MITDEQRKLFAEWLKSEADNDDQLINVMETMPPNAALTALIREREIDAAAKRRIARQLEATEVM